MAKLKTIVDFMDKELRVADFDDASNNGLQVENSGQVRKICCGVDASLAFFKAARERGADLAVCHHGISWGDSLKRITDLNYGRVGYLLRHDMALYGCHLPLDAHPRYGNNAQICKTLGLVERMRFGLYRGKKIGYGGRLPKAMRYETFKALVRKKIASDIRSMDFGRRTIRTVAVVSGGAAGETAEAGREGFDVYLSGEPALEAYSLAQEYGINVVFSGHYATEVFGVRALATLLGRRFKVETEFVDLQVPY